MKAKDVKNAIGKAVYMPALLVVAAIYKIKGINL